ncbi:glycosyltransferase family 4 protein [Serpentinicella sp. ANB-PHB4]|uniref:glycosyltransferase family 4 protein n=1 Tax=Serpentinicella sp. ANB-PHB4 TaxID=3074076 RepID=UPI00285D069C|nr:glycosyltransferase family 4 protein [Serpentinicella sp. ANB-PHB4]MDR5658759.1 glycosyltransferase family 4 protein [Serpentinicella sp. ANB-PHB4]
MKILMIVQNDFVNDTRVFKEAKTLGQEGHTVQILALHSKDLCQNESFGNFNVKRIILKTRDKLSNRNRYIQAIKYLEFFKKCLDFARKFNPDIIHCHDVYTVPIGFRIKRQLKSKLVYDSHELWSRVHNVESLPRIISKITKYFEKKAVTESDTVITVSDSISNYFVKHYELKNKPLVLRNIPNKNTLTNSSNLLRNKLNISPEEKIILYQGAVQVGRGVDKIIKLLPNLDSRIVLVILGGGPLIDKIKDLVSSLDMNARVFFHESVNQEELIDYTSSADLGIHLMQNICLNHYYALPNKIFEYLQAGIPIVCSEFPEMRKIIEDYRVGMTVDPEKLEKTAKEVNSLILDQEQMKLVKEKVRQARQVLCWENEQKILVDAYNNLAKDFNK